jgi:hypothetical protein
MNNFSEQVSKDSAVVVGIQSQRVASQNSWNIGRNGENVTAGPRNMSFLASQTSDEINSYYSSSRFEAFKWKFIATFRYIVS